MKDDSDQQSKRGQMFCSSDCNCEPFRTIHKIAHVSDIAQTSKQTQDARANISDFIAQTMPPQYWSNYNSETWKM